MQFAKKWDTVEIYTFYEYKAAKYASIFVIIKNNKNIGQQEEVGWLVFSLWEQSRTDRVAMTIWGNIYRRLLRCIQKMKNKHEPNMLNTYCLKRKGE